jgi:uncharacterized protein (TIGR02145 family)
MKTKHFSSLPLLLLAAALAFTASLSAQVTIGDEALPRPGALLDLKKTNGTAYIGSLLLPNVELPSMDSIPLGFTDAGTLTPAQRDKNSDLAGSIVYNTLADTGEGIYLWDGDSWTRINLGGSVVIKSDPGNAADCDPFKADGTCENGYDVDDPACKQAGEFVFTWIAGESFIEQLTVVDAGAGKFSVKFQPNDRASERQAILLVTSPCGNSNTFVFNQAGDPTGCGTEAVPAISSDNGTAMCTGGAVYLHISGFTGSDASKLIWTLNGQEVGHGPDYVATVAGRYIVYNGKIGCTQKSEIQITLNSGSTAPAPVEFIVVGNNGIACGAGGMANLIVTRPVSGTIVWYRDGKKAAVSTDYTLKSPDNHPSDILAKAGVWFAVVENSPCASVPTKPVTVTENTSGGGDSYEPKMKINGAIAGYKLCQNGSIYLEINNIDANYSYTWYIDNTQIGTGTSGIYTTVPASEKIVLRLRAVPNLAGCAQEALSVETVTAGAPPTVPYIIVAATGDVLCGGWATLAANPAGAASYRWFLNDSEISGNTASTLTATSVGSYTVTASSSEGCVSQKSAEKAITASEYATVSWVGASSHPATAKEKETKTYSVNVDFPVGAIYTWTIIHKEGTSGSITNGQGTPSITVSFPAAGVDTVQCAVTTFCGDAIGSPIKQEVKITAGCTPPNIASPTSPVTYSVKAGGTPPMLSVNASGSPLTYQWYSGASGSKNSTGGTTNASTYTPPATDVATAPATKNYWCEVTATGCGSVNSPTFTVNVEADPASLTPGSGSFSGKTCFDIANENSGGICGEPAGRTSQKTDFSNRNSQDGATSSYTGVQVYTFTPTNAVSHVRFYYTEPVGISIVESIVAQSSSYETGNSISSSCKVTVYYKTSLDNDLKNYTRLNTPYKLKLYAVYNSDATYSTSNNDKVLELNITLQDCSCCGAYTNKSANTWLTFMCHNLGAEESYDPFTPSKYIHGHKYQFGLANVALSMADDQSDPGNVSGWSTSMNSNTGAWPTGNDPCPAGWRLPSQVEWANVISTSNNDLIRVPDDQASTWTNSSTNYNTGLKIGDALFLPAAGNRIYSTGSLNSRGNYGAYWSSSANGTDGYYMSFRRTSQDTTDSTHRSTGFSVRCVTE